MKVKRRYVAKGEEETEEEEREGEEREGGGEVG